MTTTRPKEKHRGVFGEETRSHDKQFLFRRIAWRIAPTPALMEGLLDAYLPLDRRRRSSGLGLRG